jgi:hypothetical protein
MFMGRLTLKLPLRNRLETLLMVRVAQSPFSPKIFIIVEATVIKILHSCLLSRRGFDRRMPTLAMNCYFEQSGQSEKKF